MISFKEGDRVIRRAEPPFDGAQDYTGTVVRDPYVPRGFVAVRRTATNRVGYAPVESLELIEPTLIAKLGVVEAFGCTYLAHNIRRDADGEIRADKRVLLRALSLTDEAAVSRSWMSGGAFGKTPSIRPLPTDMPGTGPSEREVRARCEGYEQGLHEGIQRGRVVGRGEGREAALRALTAVVEREANDGPVPGR